MQPIGEGEMVEFDGLRRRKTVLDPSRPPTRAGTIVHKTVHPPLGMSHFPEDDSDDDAYHPGFFQRLRSRGKSQASSHHPVDLASLPPMTPDGSRSVSGKSDYSKALQTDTSYKPHETTIQFGTLPHPPHPHDPNFDDAPGELHPPQPPHMAKRQFSFQNVFARKRSESGTGSSIIGRPISRHSHKASKDATEEERLGLVKGDSRILLPIPSRGSREESPPGYTDDDDWGMGRLGREESPERQPSPGRGPSQGGGAALRRGGTEEWDPNDDKDIELRKPSGAFI